MKYILRAISPELVKASKAFPAPSFVSGEELRKTWLIQPMGSVSFVIDPTDGLREEDE